MGVFDEAPPLTREGIKAYLTPAQFASLWPAQSPYDWAAKVRVGMGCPTPRVGEFGFRDPERARQLDDLVSAAAEVYRVQGDLRARAALRDRFIREMRAAHPELREPTPARPTVRPQHRGSA